MPPRVLTRGILTSMVAAALADARSLRIAMSSAFLTTYTAVGVTAVVLLRHLGLRHSVVGSKLSQCALVLGGMVAGLTVLLEKKSRRVELALFVWAKVRRHCTLSPFTAAPGVDPPRSPSIRLNFAHSHTHTHLCRRLSRQGV